MQLHGKKMATARRWFHSLGFLQVVTGATRCVEEAPRLNSPRTEAPRTGVAPARRKHKAVGNEDQGTVTVKKEADSRPQGMAQGKKRRFLQDQSRRCVNTESDTDVVKDKRLKRDNDRRAALRRPLLLLFPPFDWQAADVGRAREVIDNYIRDVRDALPVAAPELGPLQLLALSLLLDDVEQQIRIGGVHLPCAETLAKQISTHVTESLQVVCNLQLRYD